MSDIFVEVEENYRRDAVRRWFSKWWRHLVVALAGMLIVGAGAAYFMSQRQNEAEAAGDALLAIQRQIQAGDRAGAATALDQFIEGAPRGYKALGLMEKAGLLEAQGDLRGAVTAFDQALARIDDPIVADSVRLRAAYLVAELDGLPAVEGRLTDVLERKTAVSFLARELIAAKAFEAGDLARARKEFQTIRDSLGAPQGAKDRASAFLTTLEAVAPPAPKDEANAASATPSKEKK